MANPTPTRDPGTAADTAVWENPGQAPAGKDPEKMLDLPPYGRRNPDPITDTPGSHPIEAGVGAAVGGAATGLTVGLTAAGPVGAIAGAAAGVIVGAIAGGYAGKGIGELIDPTTEDNWLREFFGKARAQNQTAPGSTADTYRPAYRHGVMMAASAPPDDVRPFEDAEADLIEAWKVHGRETGLTWEQASPFVRDAYAKAVQRRREGVTGSL